MNNSENSILLQTPTTVVLCIEREGNNAEKKKKKPTSKMWTCSSAHPTDRHFLILIFIPN